MKFYPYKMGGGADKVLAMPKVGGGHKKGLPFKKGGGAQNVLPCLEGWGAKSFGPGIFQFCKLPPRN